MAPISRLRDDCSRTVILRFGARRAIAFSQISIEKIGRGWIGLVPTVARPAMPPPTMMMLNCLPIVILVLLEIVLLRITFAPRKKCTIFSLLLDSTPTSSLSLHIPTISARFPISAAFFRGPTSTFRRMNKIALAHITWP